MNLKKWGYFYLPLAAIAMSLAAILIDLIYGNPLKPIAFILIGIMALIIYFGFMADKRTINLRKWGYLYLPLVAITMSLAAIIIDLVYRDPLKPAAFILIVVMLLIIYVGTKTGK